ncbi:hypothetical protein [Pararhodobacter sp.]|uniref:hypothetical protein n=1 Tax=Pararhodobacter sp. TaxID=2127056 RepID=UPI002AFE83C5|nr:hypothetical protein [Pararhodobacter sp.]
MDLPLANALGLAIFIALAGILGGTAFVMVRRDRRAKAMLRRFALERGLEYTETGRHGSQAARSMLRDDDSGLQIVITQPLTRKSGSSTVTKGGSTQLSLPDPRLDGGLAIYSTRAASGVAAAASGLLGMFDNALSRRVLSHLIGDEIGAHLGALQAFEPQDGSMVTIMASVDPTRHFDTAAIAEAIHTLPKPRHRSGMAPMILIGNQGTKIRLGEPEMDPGRLATLIDTARTLQSQLR